jgi:hypothetical protein
MKKVGLMLILFVVFFAGHLVAENKDENKVSQQEMEERIKASEELVIAMKLNETWQQTLNNMVEVQTKQFPGMTELKDVFEEFFNKYMSWDSIKDEMIKVYAEEFTVAEIKQITAFYKTPVGEKLALKMPVLTTKGAEIGQKRVQDNMLELQVMISKKMAEIEKTNKGDPNE